MIAVGAHYLPFAFLYGMRHFIVLAVAMMAPGLLVAIYAPQLSLLAALYTVLVLAIAAIVGHRRLDRERSAQAA